MAVPAAQCDALVIGAGVSGLTTAVCLAEAGLAVVVRAEDPPERTTSAAAGALWTPHLVEEGERVVAWASRTLGELESLAGDPATGVRMVSGIEAARVQLTPPDWAGAVAGFRACRDGELPSGYRSGWWFTTPLVEMGVYLGYLARRLTAAGGAIEVAAVSSIADAAATVPAVVNCAGVGARRLVPDPLVTPVRGQVVIVRNPGITEFFADVAPTSSETLYFLPHPATVVLGGTEEHGSFDLRPDPPTARRIQDRCAAVEPRLRGAEVIAHRVGLRPVRPQIRLDAQRLPGGALLCHNYGHGGAGITLSWGCAREAAELIIGEL